MEMFEKKKEEWKNFKSGREINFFKKKVASSHIEALEFYEPLWVLRNQLNEEGWFTM